MSLLPTPPIARIAPALPGASHWWTRLIHWVVEARSHRVVCLVAGIWLLNAFDLAFTLLSHQQGVLDEQNPVAKQVLEQGELSVMLYKIGLVLIGSYPLLRFRTARIAEMAAFVVLIAYAALAIRWSECYELYGLTISHSTSYADLSAAGVTPPQ